MWYAIKNAKTSWRTLILNSSMNASQQTTLTNFYFFLSICCHSRLEPNHSRLLIIERLSFKGPFLIWTAILPNMIRLKMPMIGCHWTRFFVISPLLTFHFTEHAVTEENPYLLIWGTFESMIYYHVAEYRLLLCKWLCLTILTVGKQCF